MKKNKTIVKVLSLFAIAFLILILGSCMLVNAMLMTRSQTLPNDYVPTEDSSYIYGRFFLAHMMHAYNSPSSNIVIKNLDTSKKYSFTMQGKEEETIQILPVPPGNYRIELVESLYAGERVTHDFDIGDYQRDFVVGLNTVVYLGDFTVSVVLTSFRVDWVIYPPENKYDETTADAQEKFPFLKEANITFVSNMESSQSKVAVKEMYNTIITELFSSYKKFFNIGQHNTEQPSMS